MRYKASLAAAACVIGALGLAACSSSGGGSTAGGSSSSSSQVLVMEQSPTGPVADDMNPFSTTGAGNLLGFNNMIYEPLLQFDDLKPGTWYPWLANNFTWSHGGETITFTLRSGVKFTNGEAFNASNAAWEFNLLKKYPDINTNGLPISSASAPNATTLVINFSSPQYTNLYNIADTAMVPEGVWSKISGDPGKYADTNPIGTGPYKLKTFSPQSVTLTRNTSYWQGESHVPELEYPAYDSNTSANQALEDGSLQWAGNFVQNIQSQFVNKSSSNHYWDFGLQTETIIPNLNKFPFSGSGGLAVREAISYGINRQEVSSVGEDGQQPPVQGAGSLTGITLPLDKQYVTSATAGDVATYDPAKAKSILEAAGWKMGSSGYFQKDGQTLAFSIQDPTPYTDFITDDQIMQQQLKQVGIDMSVQGTSVQAWTNNLADGNFQAMAHWGNGGISPYNMYDNWLDTTLDTNPSDATGNYEHFSGPDANKAENLLKAYAATPTSDTAAQTQDVVGLEEIVAKDLPVIPIFYGVAWFEYNDSQWSGWPSQSNMYAPGEPTGPFNEIVVLKLRPKS
ncbi:MAG TPA: ABC transporter substrate-binding protein [Trebonia sp.]|jgi:peptide/nickel transport system substrate-binding protein|nr:ABC transporter substrate-binding protein [Trebonia sp.]